MRARGVGSRTRRPAGGASCPPRSNPRQLSRVALRILALTAVCGTLAMASGSRAVIDVPGLSARLGWTPATGPVAGYEVQLARNGATFGGVPLLLQGAGATTVLVSGLPGETVRIRVRAFDASNASGPWSANSDTIRFSPAGGPATGSSGARSAMRFAILGSRLEVYAADGSLLGSSALAATAAIPVSKLKDPRSVRCDLDGDGLPEELVGFGPGSGGWVAVRDGPDAGYGSLGWIRSNWDWYNQEVGAVRPACGDLDGDGRDEIVLGLGRASRGWMPVLDDLDAGFVPMPVAAGGASWIQVQWDWYDGANGSTWPTMGDVDGDGRAELVVGLGSGANGWIVILDDSSRGLAELASGGWVRIDLGAYNSRNGETRPTAGDLDGDGRAEIAVGVGQGGGSRVVLLDDERTGFSRLGAGLVQSGWDGYDQADGSTAPEAEDFDGDGAAELLIRLGPLGRGWAQVVDDAGGGFQPRPGLAGSNGSGWVRLGTASGSGS